MKKIIALLSLCLSMSAFADVSVGKIDIQTILVSVEQGKIVREKLKAEFDKKQAILKQDELVISELQAKFEKMPESKEKTKLDSEINNKIATIQIKTKDYQEYIKHMEDKLKQPILDKIVEVTAIVSKNENIDFTYDINTSNLVYAKNEVDLTQKIIEAFNKKYPQ